MRAGRVTDNEDVPTASAAASPLDESMRCPCLSGAVYGECCAPYHRGVAQPATAERLMRSRYAAFAVGDAEYLLATWHPQTRPAALELDPALRWFRLDILARTGGGVLDTTGTVEFEARYRVRTGAEATAAPSAGVQHENSRFARVDGWWVYVDAA